MKNYMSLIIALLFFVSCAAGGGTSTGNPVTVDMSFESYDASLVSKIRRFFIKDAFAGVSTLEMCFKRMRLKLENGSVGDNADLELGKVSIEQTGTSLGMIDIVDAPYKRVEFDLDNNCDDSGAPSVYIVNENGTFQTPDSITIKFEGSFNPSEEDLNMAIQAIVDQVKTVTNNDEIKAKLEAVSGSLP